jgi:hypothetical protein
MNRHQNLLVDTGQKEHVMDKGGLMVAATHLPNNSHKVLYHVFWCFAGAVQEPITSSGVY